ncbi:MAG: zinc ribbon domain-containing protein [Thermoplasmata archaeon]
MALDMLLDSIALQWELVGGISLIICGVIWLVLWLLIAIWVYRDAESRGMSGALWLIIVILTGLIGLIIYIVVRADTGPQYPYPPQQYQPYQQPPPAQVPPAAAPPPAQPPTAARFCTNCGGSLPPGANNCPNCGEKVQ